MRINESSSGFSLAYKLPELQNKLQLTEGFYCPNIPLRRSSPPSMLANHNV